MPRRPNPGLALALALALGGCIAIPDLDAAISAEARRAGYPALIPVGGLAATATGGAGAAEAAGRTLAGRAAALRRRAEALRAPVLSGRDRRRLAAAVARHLP